MSAGGDLIPYKCIQPRHSRHLWEEAGPFFFQNDIVFANLETVADVSQAYSAAPEIMLHDMYFNIQAESFSVFSGNHQYKGYDVLSTANNHTMDMGENGILATQEFLRSRNIAYCGTSRSAEERDDFPIVERNGIKTAFLAYTFSLNKESLPAGKEWLCNHILLNEPNPDISLIVYQAKLARARGADMVVASLHMGCAYQAYPSMHTVKNIHRICREADIDIVLGGHPHNLQPMEIYTSIQHVMADLWPIGRGESAHEREAARRPPFVRPRAAAEIAGTTAPNGSGRPCSSRKRSAVRMMSESRSPRPPRSRRP